jgi:hypothetical protein
MSLGTQPNVTNHRYPNASQGFNDAQNLLAAFKLDGIRSAITHQSDSITQRILHTGMIASKWHIHSEQGALSVSQRTPDGLRVMDHLVYGQTRRRIVAKRNLSERIADENDIGAS